MIRSNRVGELALLTFPVAILLLGLSQLALSRGEDPSAAGLRAGALFGVLLVSASWCLGRRARRADHLILPLAAVLCAIGQIMVARLQPELALKQMVWIAIGVLAMATTLATLPSVGWLRHYRYIWAALGLALVGSTFIFGIDPNGGGARLWLGLGGVFFQPSEILKVLLVVFFASYLDEYRELLAFAGPRIGPLTLPPLPYLAPLMFMLVLSLLVLVLQRDLGAALLFYGIVTAMLYVATHRVSYVVLGIVMFALGSSLMYRLFEHVRLRVDVWLDPWASASTTGYQMVQALTALAAGGLFGSGVAYGFPGYVPAVHTDFIIAAAGEELGLAGSLAIVMLYMLLIHRGFRVAMACRDSFRALVAAGLVSVVAIQSLVILCGTLGLLPLTGVTLPLLSYGGSSILANFIILALLLAISSEERVQIGDTRN